MYTGFKKIALLHIYYCLQGLKIQSFVVFTKVHNSFFFWMTFFLDLVAGISSKNHQQLIDYHHEHTTMLGIVLLILASHKK